MPLSDYDQQLQLMRESVVRPHRWVYREGIGDRMFCEICGDMAVDPVDMYTDCAAAEAVSEEKR